MPSPALSKPLQGIIPPIVTPLVDRDQLDEPGLARLVDHLLDGGVHGLFALGTTGEGPSLSPRLRRQLVTHVCRQVARRVPVLVGITDTSLASAIDLAHEAADAGADAVVLAPPYYFPISQDELRDFTLATARAVHLPLVLYNMPGLTKVAFAPETVRQLMDEPRIVALKDSSGDLDYFRTVREITRAREDWNLLIGPEELLVESLALGGDGGIAGGSNLCPALFVQLYQAAQAGDAETIAKLQDQVATLAKIYRFDTESISARSVIRALKAGLETQGICSGRPAEPFLPLAAEHRQQISTILKELRA